MKTKNLVIGILTIAVVILSVLLFQKKSKECPDNDPTGNRSVACQFSSTDSCCVDITSRIDDIFISENGCYQPGELYGKGFQKKDTIYLRKLIKEGKDRNKFNQIYGYQISIDHIYEMYDAIELFNKSKIKRNKKILKVAGLRFYEAVSERTIKGQLKRKVDLVMIPYLSSGEDIFLIDDLPHTLDEEIKAYTYFRPCPRLCSDKKIYIHQ
ncbi:hypothetical protein [Fluviicola sp.]|uniref:hypothetical protein n=1 Tax=Fluviicola sp. TaxID=1917219 RepID=UPI0031DBC3F8